MFLHLCLKSFVKRGKSVLYSVRQGHPLATAASDFHLPLMRLFPGPCLASSFPRKESWVEFSPRFHHWSVKERVSLYETGRRSKFEWKRLASHGTQHSLGGASRFPASSFQPPSPSGHGLRGISERRQQWQDGDPGEPPQTLTGLSGASQGVVWIPLVILGDLGEIFKMFNVYVFIVMCLKKHVAH